jgi:hypothetical protein
VLLSESWSHGSKQEIKARKDEIEKSNAKAKVKVFPLQLSIQCTI